MAVSDILDAIENLVVESKRIVFTNKCIIEESELIRLVDDLRNELPQELQEAETIMQEQDKILSDAREEAQQIIDKAKTYANQLVDESAIVKQSQEKSELIMAQAKAQHDEIINRTLESAQELSANANQYANQVFEHLVSNVGVSLQVLQQAQEDLQKMPMGPEIPEGIELPDQPMQPMTPQVVDGVK
ncbi:MAG: ATPase [Selenomonadaceae bacterium]